MSKEIYKEYVNKYFFECTTYEEKKTLNDGYIWNKGVVMNFSEYNEDAGEYVGEFFIANSSEYKFIARKPKTQMINGHEVVAPRYDMPEHREDIIVMNCFNKRGIEVINFSAKTMRDVTSWGWFSTDNTGDAIAYANAHRENKND